MAGLGLSEPLIGVYDPVMGAFSTPIEGSTASTVYLLPPPPPPSPTPETAKPSPTVTASGNLVATVGAAPAPPPAPTTVYPEFYPGATVIYPTESYYSPAPTVATLTGEAYVTELGPIAGLVAAFNEKLDQAELDARAIATEGLAGNDTNLLRLRGVSEYIGSLRTAFWSDVSPLIGVQLPKDLSASNPVHRPVLQAWERSTQLREWIDRMWWAQKLEAFLFRDPLTGVWGTGASTLARGTTLATSGGAIGTATAGLLFLAVLAVILTVR